MLGRVSNFVQGNPVYDFDRNDYIGAYVPGRVEARGANVTLNVGVRWEPFLPIKNTLDYVSNFDEARFDAGIRSTVYPQAPPGLLFPGRRRLSGLGGDEEQAGRSSRRAPASSGS